ncbi:Uncharacterized protein TSPI_07850 [Trichinella spiralis]|uniref:Uncharacterized protein n=1 Tax=Trichinella spiralis TaxID=6334 RepID=A0ABR3KWS7_TRISP
MLSLRQYKKLPKKSGKANCVTVQACGCCNLNNGMPALLLYFKNAKKIRFQKKELLSSDKTSNEPH